jgi:hypothetical protein
VPICFKLLVQDIARALSRALDKAGSSIAAKIAMIAITTSNSMRVNEKNRLALLAISYLFMSVFPLFVFPVGVLVPAFNSALRVGSLRLFLRRFFLPSFPCFFASFFAAYFTTSSH